MKSNMSSTENTSSQKYFFFCIFIGNLEKNYYKLLFFVAKNEALSQDNGTFDLKGKPDLCQCKNIGLNEPQNKKNGFQSFPPGLTQTDLYSH